MESLQRTQLTDHPSHALHVVANHSPDGYKPTKDNMALITNNHTVQIRSRAIVRASPTSSISSGLLNAGNIQIRVEPGVIDLLTHAYLQIDITNDTGAAVTLSPAQLMIEKIDITADNGATLISQLYGDQLFLENVFLSRNEMEQIESFLGINPNYSTTGTTLANGESTVYYVPIMRFLYPARLHLSGLRGELLFRVQFKSSSFTIISGSVPTVTNLQMLLKGFYEDQSLSDARKSVYHGQKPLLIPFIDADRQINDMTLAASSTYSITLSGIRGIMMGLFFTIKVAAETAANQANFLPIESFDLQDPAGKSVIGHYRRTDDDQKMESAELWNNLFNEFKDFYFVSFSENPQLDWQTGSNFGSRSMDGFYKLSFTTRDDLTPGDHKITIIGLNHQHASIVKGKLVASRS